MSAGRWIAIESGAMDIEAEAPVESIPVFRRMFPLADRLPNRPTRHCDTVDGLFVFRAGLPEMGAPNQSFL